jgi:mitochondrial enoyl-[acyl-carrier protein] reductase / trans-2-enoyl-CoA reductase
LRRDLPRTRKLALKKVQITGFGEPEDVAECVECPEVGEPAADEVIFDVVAFPINPADIAFCRGRYRLKPPLPATPGAEGAGRVVSVGEAVTGGKPGNLIIHLDRENWAQRRRVKADRVVVLPHGTDVLQAAMIRINPPTAMLLLSEFVTDLRPQDWIIQNVANSAVGRLVTLFARERNLHTISVVRRDHVFSELYDLGADACVVDGPDLAASVAAFTKGAPIRLGIDAVAGSATARIASCVADGGMVCTYGAMSGVDIAVPAPELIFRGIEFRGFLLGRYLEHRSIAKIGEIYLQIARKVHDGIINTPVEWIYPIDHIKDALAHAQRGARHGKILVAPNGLQALRDA